MSVIEFIGKYLGGLMDINLPEIEAEPQTNDNEAPNLFVGKKIGCPRLEGEVISFDDDGMLIKITKVNDKYFERYVDVGQTYPLFAHKHWRGELLLWKVKSESMKRQVSQLLLQWEKEIGWNWDLDF